MQQLLQANQDILTIAQDAARYPAGTHRLGVPYTLGPYFLPDVIPEIHRLFPALRFFVKEDTPRNLERGLSEGVYDLILTPLPLDINTLAHEPLFAEPLFMVAPPDHTLAQKKRITPDDFINENFLVIEERHRFFIHIQQLAKDYGFNLLRDFEGTSLDTLRQMVGTGMGISFFPALYVRSEIAPRNDVITLDLGFSLPQRNIAIAWRSTSLQKHIYQQISRVIRSCCRENLAGHVEVMENAAG
ncbi:MAG: LysR substrate-binding domain-containing protein, partial [Rickettsiales bacterium]